MKNSKPKWWMSTSGIWNINYIFISMLQQKHIIKDITTQKDFQLINLPILIMVMKIIICIMMIHTMHTRVITSITMNTIHGMQVTPT